MSAARDCALDARRRLGVEGRIEIINLIGEEVFEHARWLAEPIAAVHLYGKTHVRPGRKMGHVTRVSVDPAK